MINQENKEISIKIPPKHNPFNNLKVLLVDILILLHAYFHNHEADIVQHPSRDHYIPSFAMYRFLCSDVPQSRYLWEEVHLVIYANNNLVTTLPRAQIFRVCNKQHDRNWTLWIYFLQYEIHSSLHFGNFSTRFNFDRSPSLFVFMLFFTNSENPISRSYHVLNILFLVVI